MFCDQSKKKLFIFIKYTIALYILRICNIFHNIYSFNSVFVSKQTILYERDDNNNLTASQELWIDSSFPCVNLAECKQFVELFVCLVVFALQKQRKIKRKEVKKH